jgi:hypothetical protein
MAHEVIQCAGWCDFSVRATSKLFPGGAFERGVFLFRGIALPEWPLISTFDRWYGAIPHRINPTWASGLGCKLWGKNRLRGSRAA